MEGVKPNCPGLVRIDTAHVELLEVLGGYEASNFAFPVVSGFGEMDGEGAGSIISEDDLDLDLVGLAAAAMRKPTVSRERTRALP